MVQQVLKLVPIFPITPIVLTLLPFTRASQKHAETDISHTIKKHDMHKLSPHSSFEITLHGFLLWLGFVAFLMPIGILVIRMSNREECERRAQNYVLYPGESKGRSVWFLVHWGLGSAISLPGIINVYTGLQAYHKRTSKSINLWTIILTAEVSVMALFYLFQDKRNYIQKQGVILIFR